MDGLEASGANPDLPLCPRCSQPLTSPGTACARCGATEEESEGTYDVVPRTTDIVAYFGPPVHVEESAEDLPEEKVPERFRERGADDQASEETPEHGTDKAPASPPRRARRIAGCWLLLLGLGIVAAVVEALLGRGAKDPSVSFERQEEMYERFLSAKALQRVDLPDAFDADAIIDAEGRGDPAALAEATKAHWPLARAEGMTIHQFFEAFLERYLEILPEASFRLGVHPHPHRVSGDDEATRLRYLMLIRDACRALRAWQGEESPHDRADRAALLGRVEFELRWHRTRDIDLLDNMTGWLYTLTHLAEVHCCRVEDRVDAACARLKNITTALPNKVTLLSHPPRALVLATAQELDDGEEYLAHYEEEFGAPASSPQAAIRDLFDSEEEAPEATPPSQAKLRDAVGPAREAVRECARRLREEVFARADGSLGVGRENVALLLRIWHHLPLDAVDVYRRDLEELRAAHGEMLRLGARARTGGARFEGDEKTIASLREASKDWVTHPPLTDRVQLLHLQKYAEDRGAVASYMDPGTLGPSEGGVVHLHARRPEGDAASAAWQARARRHTLAHEGYPGHRMDALFGRLACRLRRFIDDRVRVEGWGVYSEDLLHETGHCAGDEMDAYMRASTRADLARSGMVALLIQTGAASDEEVLELLRWDSRRSVALVDVGERASAVCYPLDYLLGRDEIRDLRHREETRLGAAFDLKAFHARLLSEGPIPIPLIEEEWAAEK